MVTKTLDGSAFSFTSLKGHTTHISILWVFVLFCFLAVAVVLLAGYQEGLMTRRFGSVDVNGNLKVTGNVRNVAYTYESLTANATTLVEGVAYKSAVIQPGDLTLPSPDGIVGGKIQLVVDVVGTTSDYAITTPAGVFYDAAGEIFLGQTTASLLYASAAHPDGTANNTLTMANGNGAWGIGTVFTFTATDSTHWRVDGHIIPSTANPVTAAYSTA